MTASHSSTVVSTNGLATWTAALLTRASSVGWKRACLFEDLLGRFGLGDIRLDEMSVLREIVAKLGAVHADHTPAICRKVTVQLRGQSPRPRQ